MSIKPSAGKKRFSRWGKIARQAWSFQQGNPAETLVFLRDYFRARRHTHASIIDLLHLRSFVKELHMSGLRGDIVECGCWRGGASALMYKAASDLGWKPDIYIYDSFEGFPKPAEEKIDGRKAQGIHEGQFDWIKANEADVVEIFKKFGLYSGKVHIIKGWFAL